MDRRRLIVAGIAMFVIAVGALIVYLVIVGLDDADKIASVVGMVAALVGLALAVVGTTRGDRTAGDGGKDGQSVSDSTVLGHVIQSAGSSAPQSVSGSVVGGYVSQTERSEIKETGQVADQPPHES